MDGTAVHGSHNCYWALFYCIFESPNRFDQVIQINFIQSHALNLSNPWSTSNLSLDYDSEIIMRSRDCRNRELARTKRLGLIW
jgi:hypothetical protein